MEWGWRQGNLHGNGDGDLLWGRDGENLMGMGTVLFNVSLSTKSNKCQSTN